MLCLPTRITRIHFFKLGSPSKYETMDWSAGFFQVEFWKIDGQEQSLVAFDRYLKNEDLSQIFQFWPWLTRLGLLENTPASCVALQILADHSKIERVKEAYADSGILNECLNALNPQSGHQHVNEQFLRVIGNCCANNDDNRRVTIAYMRQLSACVSRQDIYETAIKALFNICNENSDTQKAALASGLDIQLAQSLCENWVDLESPETEYVVDLLFWMNEHMSDEYTLRAGAKHVQNIESAAERIDSFECYVNLVWVVLTYLKSAPFRSMIAGDWVNHKSVFGLVKSIASQREKIKANWMQQRSTIPTASDDLSEDLADMHSQLDGIQRELLYALAELSSEPSFSNHGAVSETVIRLNHWLHHGSSELERTVACIMLGNLANNDGTCRRMVLKADCHIAVLRILHRADGSKERLETTFAAAQFLKNLAKPPQTKPHIGLTGVKAALRIMQAYPGEPRLVLQAAGLVRALVQGQRDTAAYVVTGQRLLPDSSELSSPAMIASSEQDASSTVVGPDASQSASKRLTPPMSATENQDSAKLPSPLTILSSFLNSGPAFEKHVSTEIACAVVALVRTLSNARDAETAAETANPLPATPGDVQSHSEPPRDWGGQGKGKGKMLATSAVDTVLDRLVRMDRVPEAILRLLIDESDLARWEALVGLGHLVRVDKGARTVRDALKNSRESGKIFEVLKDMISASQSGPFSSKVELENVERAFEGVTDENEVKHKATPPPMLIPTPSCALYPLLLLLPLIPTFPIF
ncbi:armadillo-type protein [Lineolata rhizophorae]|uniref:Armadillo-type protein n=1 Tax=Lineolata rhizophorae TaxID=578093 RepID=A0A6A6P1Q3_9PEZI|nr:armadillo-type protein [Lineolata rhizophorae]